MNFMKTITPHVLTEEELKMISSNLIEEVCLAPIDVPLQTMFDEFMSFISKTDFE